MINVIKWQVSIVCFVSPWGLTGQTGHLLATRKQARGNRVRKCVCSCSLVCLVQNWFRAPGHRKTTALHSRHVCEASSRGSTIAIQQRRLQTPKWVCSVLQCPAWQSATYSASSAPNISSPLSCCYILSCCPSFHSLSLSVLPLKRQNLSVILSSTLWHSLSSHAFNPSVTFSLHSQSIVSTQCALIGQCPFISGFALNNFTWA